MKRLAFFLDIGHGTAPNGADDDGATGGGTTERAIVLAVAQALLPLLKPLPLLAIPVGLEERLSVIEKTKLIQALCRDNKWTKKDVFLVSLHTNAGAPTSRGCEAWYGTRRADGRMLADCMVRGLGAGTTIPFRKTPLLPSDKNRLGRLGILDDVTPPGCLIELGFITNEKDRSEMLDANRVARALVAGLVEYLSFVMPDHFKDVPADAFYKNHLELCLKEGIVEMPDDANYHPDRPVSRGEMAVFAARLLRKLPQ